MALFSRNIQGSLAVLIHSQLSHLLWITIHKDLLDMGNIACPRCEEEWGVAPLPRAVLALFEALLLLHGQELEAYLLLYPPEALQFFKGTMPSAGLLLHVQNQEEKNLLLVTSPQYPIYEESNKPRSTDSSPTAVAPLALVRKSTGLAA
jgi:hypothetical protein